MGKRVRNKTKRLKKKGRREEKTEFLLHGWHFFLGPQADAEADGGELTEDGRRRNGKA